MAAIFSKKKRSEVMSRIRGAGNKATELRLIQIFRANEITGWRRGCSLVLALRSSKAQGTSAKKIVLKSKILGSRPKVLSGRSSGRVKADFVFPKQKLAVFVDGCFWHGCPKHGTSPKTRASFWLAKISGNKARDSLVNRLLRKRGWKVIRIWEHELTNRNLPRLLRRFSRLRDQPSPRLRRDKPPRKLRAA